MTVLQICNWAFLFANVHFQWITSVFFMMPFYVWVGLMGGATYVNVMYKLLQMESLGPEDKQGALVLSLMFQEVGKILSAIFTLYVSNTIFQSRDHWQE